MGSFADIYGRLTVADVIYLNKVFGHWRSIVERFKPDGDCDYFVNNARLKGSKGNKIDADTAPSLIITPKE